MAVNRVDVPAHIMDVPTLNAVHCDPPPLSMFGPGQPVRTSHLQAVLGLVSPVPQAHPPQIVLHNGLLMVRKVLRWSQQVKPIRVVTRSASRPASMILPLACYPLTLGLEGSPE